MVDLAAAQDLVRTVHFLAAMILFGAAAYPFYAHAGRGSPGGHGPGNHVLAAGAGVSLLSGLAWLALSFADIAGGIAGFADPDLLAAYFLGTGFGEAWLVRLVLLIALCRLAARDAYGRMAALPVLAAASLAGLAFIGHASQAQGVAGVLAKTVHALHLIAGAGWVGGLLMLAIAVRRDGAARSEAALRRFSLMGIGAVAFILLTGLLKTAGNLDSPADLTGTEYGRLLSAKIALVLVMVAMAAVNRFILMPRRLGLDGETRRRLLRALIAAEFVLGIIVITLGARLGVDPRSG